LADSGVSPILPERCAPIGDPPPSSARVRAFAFFCDGGLAGKTVAVRGLGPVHTEAIVRLLAEGKAARSAVLTPERPAWRGPSEETRATGGAGDLVLGIEHILSGPDHLLFLIALVLYVRRLRTLIWTETAFTLSHSLTFSLTALGLIRVWAPAAEACIALSLVLVAQEIAIGRRDGG